MGGPSDGAGHAAADRDPPPRRRRASGPGRRGAPHVEAMTGRSATGDGVRPLAVSGIVAAIWCAGLGLTTLTTITLIGWIAAPRTALGTGLPGVFRTASTSGWSPTTRASRCRTAASACCRSA